MKRREGLMSIGIAIIILLFSIVAAMVIYNISSNLYKTVIRLDEGKELQYRRIIIMSLKNVTDRFHNDILADETNVSTFTFTFSKCGEVPDSFPATISVATASVTVKDKSFGFLELFTKPPELDTYGIVVQYDRN